MDQQWPNEVEVKTNDFLTINKNGYFKENDTFIKIYECKIKDFNKLKKYIIDKYGSNQTEFIISKCFLFEIPIDFFDEFKQITNIDLSQNLIKELNFNLPTNLVSLNMSYNDLGSGITIQLPNTLENLNISYTHVKTLDNIDIKINVNYYYSDVPYIVQRPNVINNGRQNQQPIINDHQNKEKNVNVHDVQDNIKLLIQKLMSNDSFSIYPPVQDYINELLNIFIKANKINKHCPSRNSSYSSFKRYLLMYDNIDECIIYDYNLNKKCKIKHLLERICLYIKINIFQNEMIENLHKEMIEGATFCFVGKYTRILNTLITFVDEFKIDLISDNDKISNRIIQLKKQYTDINKIIKKIKEFMDNLEISKENQQIWINALEEE